MLTKVTSLRPHPCHKETQTEGLTQPVPIPIPVPIHVPTPCKMYNAPFPGTRSAPYRSFFFFSVLHLVPCFY